MTTSTRAVRAPARPSLDELIARSKAMVAAMSPAEYAAMIEAQRQSWVRAMAPCEHGISDWEDCPDCRHQHAASETPDGR